MRRIRSLTVALTALVVAAVPAAALAHAELVSAQPAADEVLGTAPDEVVVTFDSELDPDASSLTVLAADGRLVAEGGVDLDVADRNVLRAAAALPGDGAYRVTWTAGSIDGHVESGDFGFRVGAAPEPDVADTALPVPPPNPAAAGALLLVIGGVLGVGERRRRTR